MKNIIYADNKLYVAIFLTNLIIQYDNKTLIRQQSIGRVHSDQQVASLSFWAHCPCAVKCCHVSKVIQQSTVKGKKKQTNTTKLL